MGHRLGLDRGQHHTIAVGNDNRAGPPAVVSVAGETDDAGETVCRVTVRNTALREITSQARVDTREGSATSNEVSTTVPVLAKEVCLHIHVTGGDFVSAPKYEDGKTAAHVRADRELIVFLGNMKPSQERSLTVRARADQGVSQESNSAS